MSRVNDLISSASDQDLRVCMQAMVQQFGCPPQLEELLRAFLPEPQHAYQLCSTCSSETSFPKSETSIEFQALPTDELDGFSPSALVGSNVANHETRDWNAEFQQLLSQCVLCRMEEMFFLH